MQFNKNLKEFEKKMKGLDYEEMKLKIQKFI